MEPESKCGAGIPACEEKDLNLKHFYRRRLPHLRNAESIYFVTWRLDKRQRLLSYEDRTIISSALLHFNRLRYHLVSFVVMDDHVHVIFHPNSKYQLHEIVHSWKSFSANRLSVRSQRVAPIWQDEYFDRIIRNGSDLADKVYYVRSNPETRWPECVNYPWLFENIKEYL